MDASLFYKSFINGYFGSFWSFGITSNVFVCNRHTFFFSIHHTRLFFRNNKLTFPPGKSSILISPTLAALMFFGNRKGTYICISLVISKVEHPFVQLLSLDFFFFWKLSILCSHYSIGVLFFQFVRALGTLYRAYQTVHIWIIAC